MSNDSPHPLQTIANAAQQSETYPMSQQEIDERLARITDDFERGFELLRQQHDTVTFFGSARLQPDNEWYQRARRLARRIVEEIGSTVVTGGGGGIMAAANQGACRADGTSVGMTIELPHEQVTNSYVNETVDFYYFFSRKVALSFTARAYIYFPGGFGTLDEFFEILTLKQTAKIKPIPIILVGSEFWQPLLDYIETTLREQYGTISPEDAELYTLLDDDDEIINAISTQDTYRE